MGIEAADTGRTERQAWALYDYDISDFGAGHYVVTSAKCMGTTTIHAKVMRSTAGLECADPTPEQIADALALPCECQIEAYASPDHATIYVQTPDGVPIGELNRTALTD